MEQKAGTGVSREGSSQSFTLHWRNCFLFAFLALSLVLCLFATVHTSKAVVSHSQLQDSQAEVPYYGLQSAAALGTSSSVCQGQPKIYVYDNLPADFNSDLLVPFCAGEVHFFEKWCEALCNGGLGKRMSIEEHPGWEDLVRDSEHTAESLARLKQKVDFYETLWMGSRDLVPPQAWFKTEPFSLELLFHERMKVHPCRTKDPEQASLFYVPFYATLDVTHHLWSKHHLRDRLFQRLIGWLMAQEPWLRYPHKHMFVLGRMVWDFARTEDDDWGNAFLRQPELADTTKVLIEQSMQSNAFGRGQMAVPYPTAFHPASDAELQEWRAALEASRRDRLVSFIGARRNVVSDMAKFRDLLFSQCQSHPECTLLDCADFNCLRHEQYLLSLMLRSVFCLQPEGDNPTRRATFDSLLTGCIPVFFTRESAYRQYLWHLPANSSSWSVFIPEQQVRDGLELVPLLARIPLEQVRAMQRAVFDLLPHIVYSMPGHDSQRTFGDAVDLTLQHASHASKQ